MNQSERGLTKTQQSEQRLSQWLANDEVKTRLVAAVGDVMDAEQFISHALVSLQDPKLAKCSAKSKLDAMMNMAALGLLETLGQVRLSTYGYQLKAMPQWQGFKSVMERHPSILEVRADLVHSTDSFELVNGQPQHNYDPFDDGRTFDKPSDLRGGYLTIIYMDGRPPKYHFVSISKIEKNRKCAQTQKIWNSWYREMCLKTIYRDAYARRAVPVDPLVNSRLEQLTRVDDLVLGNDPSRVVLPESPQVAYEGTKARLLNESPPEMATDDMPADPPSTQPARHNDGTLPGMGDAPEDQLRRLKDETLATIKRKQKIGLVDSAVVGFRDMAATLGADTDATEAAYAEVKSAGEARQAALAGD